jgi:hypothetical protein
VAAGFSEAVFFERNEPLLGKNESNASFDSGEGFYLRLLPRAEKVGQSLSKSELQNAVAGGPRPLGTASTDGIAINRYGAILYHRMNNE